MDNVEIISINDNTITVICLITGHLFKYQLTKV